MPREPRPDSICPSCGRNDVDVINGIFHCYVCGCWGTSSVCNSPGSVAAFPWRTRKKARKKATITKTCSFKPPPMGDRWEEI